MNFSVFLLDKRNISFLNHSKSYLVTAVVDFVGTRRSAVGICLPFTCERKFLIKVLVVLEEELVGRLVCSFVRSSTRFSINQSLSLLVDAGESFSWLVVETVLVEEEIMVDWVVEVVGSWDLENFSEFSETLISSLFELVLKLL